MPSKSRTKNNESLKIESESCQASEGQQLRLGLFGGSFNPVHLGHVLVARAALEELGLHRVYFVPAGKSPFKDGESLAPAKHRLCMLRLALAGETKFEIDEQELHRPGPSYTIITVRNYARRFPGARLFCLVGSDNVKHLPRWREAESLAELTEFVVVLRPGDRVPRLPSCYRVRVINGFPFSVSSSQLRDRIRSGRRIDWLTPPAVAEYIVNNKLYL